MTKRARTDAHRAADKRYAAKRMTYTISYTPTDYADGLRLRSYLDLWGISANAAIKMAVKAYLDSIGYPYPDTDDIDQDDQARS